MNDNVVPINGQFRFAEQEKVYWPVTVVKYGDSPDQQDSEHEIQWLVSLLKRDAHAKLELLHQRAQQLARLANQGQDVTEQSLKVGEEIAQIVLDNVHGWRGFVGEDGTEIAVNKKNKLMLLNNYRLFQSAVGALFAASGGAVRKNSKAGAGG